MDGGRGRDQVRERGMDGDVDRGREGGGGTKGGRGREGWRGVEGI